MKATVAAAAALLGGVTASNVHHRHAHDAFHGLEKKGHTSNDTCGCTTIYSTYYGEATLIPSTPKSTAAPSTTTAPIVVPTPVAQTCPTPGVYTFPATTVTLTETTTVCAASTTSVPAGTHTLGGVTTVVTTATTVTCPYATVSTTEGVTTSVIKTTTYVCPSAGTYTIGQHTTSVEKDTTIAVPVVTTYCPGTYTQPELTTTITETSTIVYCPFSVPTTTAAVPAVSTSPAQVASTPAGGYPVATSSVGYSTPSSSSSGSTPTGLTGNGNSPWAITYTPYTETGSCKAKDDVYSDIKAIAAAGISAVRVYSTDCDTLPNVGGACQEYGLKIILGIYIDTAHCAAKNPTVSDQISTIKSWAQWDIVDLIVVANEAIFNGYCSASELASLITQCKSEFSGYTGPYTTSDTVAIWQDSSNCDTLCPVVDMVGGQAHPYFNTETSASQAGSFVRGQLDILNAACPGKEARVLETGWPSSGVCNGAACAGTAEQAEAISSLLSEVGQEAVFFSLTDDKWKDGNTACQCEQSWGCASALGLAGVSA